MTAPTRLGSAFGFAFVATAGGRLLMLGADLVLMRLLEVEVFGLAAFGLMVVGACALLRSLGVGEALIQAQRLEPASRDTAFFMALALGSGAWLALWTVAPWVAGLLADGGPLAVSVLRALGAVLLLDAAAGVPVALMERRLDFRRKCLVELAPVLVYAGVAVGLAFGQWGVWSLVWGRLAAAAAGCAVAWGLSDYRPGLCFDWGQVRRLGNYGALVAGGGLVSFFVVNLDDAVLARCGGSVELGLYYKAYLWANLPATALAHIVNRVTFPAYARMGDGRPRLYRATVGAVALVALPFALGLACLPDIVVGVLWGAAWAGMVPLLPSLAAYGLLRALLSNSGALFNACGAPQQVLKINAAQLVLLALCLYPAVLAYGALGASWAVLGVTALLAPFTFFLLNRTAGVGSGVVWKAIGPWMPSTLVLGGFLILGRGLVADWTEQAALQLAWLVLGGGILYGGSLFWWRRRQLQDCLDLLRGRGL